jgi:hypothetical protein
MTDPFNYNKHLTQRSWGRTTISSLPFHTRGEYMHNLDRDEIGNDSCSPHPEDTFHPNIDSEHSVSTDKQSEEELEIYVDRFREADISDTSDTWSTISSTDIWINEESLTESEINALRMIRIKLLKGISTRTYDEINMVCRSANNFRTDRKILLGLTGLKQKSISCCEQGCMSFVEDEVLCTFCNTPRGDAKWLFNSFIEYNKKACQIATYREKLEYRYNFKLSQDGSFKDIFDGAHYRTLLEQGYFKSKKDIALGLTTDGFCIFTKKTKDCWLVGIINLNLDPIIRTALENVFVVGLIPGPKAPRDLDSYLRPLFEEIRHHNLSASYKIHIIQFTADTKAFEKVLHMKGCCAYQGCFSLA